MEFKFSVNEIFPGPIVEINQSLIPPGFAGDRRALWDAIHKVSEVVNAMGDASAQAQGLTKPITSAERLRNSDQTIYLLVDKNAKDGKGVVTGMLKTGKKSLYVFDRDGHHYQVAPPCVLDFYVHESRQRTGLGKQLFEHMLQKEQVEPVKLAVDRPSEKLLSFLDKHYALNSALRQMNNYVVFDGFFPEPHNNDMNGDSGNSDSPSRAKQSANGLQQNFASSFGRYGAPRPHCSMGQIIHNQSPVQSNEPSGPQSSRRRVTKQAVSDTQQQQQPNYSNQAQPGVCQSAPNMAPHGQQNIQHYGQPNLVQPQQYNVQQLQPNMQQQSFIQPQLPPNVLQQQQPNIPQPYMSQSNLQQQFNLQGQNSQRGNNGMSPRINPPYDYQFMTDPYRRNEPSAPVQSSTVSQPSLLTPQQQYLQPAANISQPQLELSAPVAPPQLQQPYSSRSNLQAQQFLQPQQSGGVPQQFVPQQQIIPPSPPPQQQIMQPQPVASVQHVAQPPQIPSPHQNMSVVSNIQQQQPMQPTPSQPTLFNTPPYQHFVQPPNTEQPMHIKPGQQQYVTAAPAGVQSGQSTPQIPYQYYDSTAAAMQTQYAQPYVSPAPTAQNDGVPRSPNAAGDMPPTQNSPEFYKQQGYASGNVTPARSVTSAPQPQIQSPRGVYQQQPDSSIPSQDQSGQMFAQNVQPQGQPLSGEQRKPFEETVSQSPKLERPRSLSIQRSEEAEILEKLQIAKSEVHPEEPAKKSDDDLDNIENDVEKIEIAESVPQLHAANASTKGSVDGSDESDRSKSPNPLTSQGFFDLKFYHSRLW